MSESVPGSPNQELLRRLSYLSRGDDSGAEDGAEEEAVVEEYSSTEVKALPTPHYHLQKWFPDDPSSIPKETQQLWLDRASTPLIDPDCFARRRNFVVSDLHVLLVDADRDERGKIKDALGRKWQCSTVQCDFNLPERFGLEYRAASGTAERPIMVHRAIFGSIERFFGVLIESTAGDFPFWIAPTQLRLLPVSDDFLPFCNEVL